VPPISLNNRGARGNAGRRRTAFEISLHADAAHLLARSSSTRLFRCGRTVASLERRATVTWPRNAACGRKGIVISQRQPARATCTPRTYKGLVCKLLRDKHALLHAVVLFWLPRGAHMARIFRHLRARHGTTPAYHLPRFYWHFLHRRRRMAARTRAGFAAYAVPYGRRHWT